MQQLFSEQDNLKQFFVILVEKQQQFLGDTSGLEESIIKGGAEKLFVTILLLIGYDSIEILSDV